MFTAFEIVEYNRLHMAKAPVGAKAIKTLAEIRKERDEQQALQDAAFGKTLERPADGLSNDFLEAIRPVAKMGKSIEGTEMVFRKPIFLKLQPAHRLEIIAETKAEAMSAKEIKAGTKTGAKARA